MKLFAIAAKPVLHSLSPALHNHAFQKLGLDATYTRLAVDSAEEALELMREMGISGINVSAPFKEAMYRIVEQHDDAAKQTSAVNTVILKEGRFCGYNTDVYGVAASLAAHGITVDNKTVLILGNGGAAKAAFTAIASLGGKPVIAARKSGAEILDLDETTLNKTLETASGVISTIPHDASIINNLKLSKSHFALDAIYKGQSPLKQKAASVGAEYIDGMSWLSNQAAAALEHFIDRPVSASVFDDAPIIHPKSALPLFFTGLMGSGKSSVGATVAQALHRSYRDLDCEIENAAGYSVADLFTAHGEPHFRTLETESLQRALSDHIECISCGGGIVTQEINRALLKRQGICIWLWADINCVLGRLQGDKTRPLLQENRSEALKNLLEARKNLYASCADLVVNTSHKDIDSICSQILYEYHQTFKD